MTRDEFIKLHPWVDPTRGYPDDTLIDGVTENTGHVLVRTFSSHKVMPSIEPIHSKLIEHVDGHDWEMFFVHYVSDKYVWGAYLEGLGMFNVMVPREFVRELLPAEREAWSKVVLGMYGSHSGKFSYSLPSGVQP